MRWLTFWVPSGLVVLPRSSIAPRPRLAMAVLRRRRVRPGCSLKSSVQPWM
jgi:hypothetical protein